MSRLTDEIAEFGAIGGEGSGVSRFAWSAEVLEAHALLEARGREAGFSAHTDPAGNTVVEWEAGDGPGVLVGSHLDTVPSGGRYDGALGVLSGLEALRTLRERGFAPARPLGLVSFTDEEGTRFGTSFLGSRAFCGDDVSDLLPRRDADGFSVAEAMEARGFDPARIPEARAIDRYDAYVELHIEQGPVLETEGVEIGVVTAIVGLIGLRVRLTGQANHAGTTPMALRRDALAGGARAVLELRELARGRNATTATVGIIGVEPGGKNVVPGACELTVDARCTSLDEYRRLDADVRGLLARIAEDEGLGLEVTDLTCFDPVPLDTGIQDAIARAAELEGASWRTLPSGAGHDAMVLGTRIAAGMLFVPSRGGISHNPAEHTAPGHCDLGARVLARTLELLAG